MTWLEKSHEKPVYALASNKDADQATHPDDDFD